MRRAAALLGNRRRLAELHEELDHLIARDVVAALVRHRKPFAQHFHRLVAFVLLEQGGPQELKYLGKLWAQLEGPAKGGGCVLVLLRLQQQLPKPKMPELIVRIIARHLAELGDAFLKLTHREKLLLE